MEGASGEGGRFSPPAWIIPSVRLYLPCQRGRRGEAARRDSPARKCSAPVTRRSRNSRRACGVFAPFDKGASDLERGWKEGPLEKRCGAYRRSPAFMINMDRTWLHHGHKLKNY